MALTFLRAELEKWINLRAILEKLSDKHKVDPLTALVREIADVESRIRIEEAIYPVSIAKHLDEIGFEQGRRRILYQWLREEGLCENLDVYTPTGTIAVKNPTKLAVEQNYARDFNSELLPKEQREWTKEGLILLIAKFRKLKSLSVWPSG